MIKRMLLCILPLLILGGCSDDDPTTPSASRTGVGFADFSTGEFIGGNEAGFHIEPFGGVAPRDGLTVTDVPSGGRGLKDASNANILAAEFWITSADQRLFTFTGIDVCDLLGTAGTTPGSEVRVQGYYASELVGTKYYSATATAMTTNDAGSLLGLTLTSLHVSIASLGDDDLCVGFVELAHVAPRLLDFYEVPTGALEHIFVGDFEVTRIAAGAQPQVVDNGLGLRYIQDDNSDLLASVFVVERTDGGAMTFDGLIAHDLEGPVSTELHVDSGITIEGYDGATLVASEVFKPFDLLPSAFEPGALDGFEVTSLRVSLKSVCGEFKCDDMVIGGLLITNVE